ncbi:GSCFA domain-containing protein [Paracoccus shanxieyensis]|uniref:GSCFA domain-containing protein n=1 Tax=Paracoccus shanxieyensis TaxID=2675752 RepID=A0A6L6IS43_9RHOB|nr:GSCFA domain-containing protein [Paracoccus shanxieyensis]MTH63286.1 hypothetical protein [Paracoccus shanxieyensis]MTH87200.1 hypothetical protein [Paracoccus shanxieyensis]
MTHPYVDLPKTAFWRSGVAEAGHDGLVDIFRPAFDLPRDAAIATAGSCFAQHVGRALREAGMTVLDAEPPPPGCMAATARRFGYRIYSARYGNIYTTRQLLQLVQDALADHVDAQDIWEKDGRFYDALRPTVEPEGLSSLAEAIALRHAHLAAVRSLFSRCSHFIFTLGLTETWAHRQTGRVWPTCPGTVAGRFDDSQHGFLNLGVSDVLADLAAIRTLLQQIRPQMRIILTVSPVPLTATASGGHVLAATTRSKSVLRAAADEFAAAHADVDYFPSYEIVTNPAARGAFFQPNLREVTAQGVNVVMRTFLAAYGLAAMPAPRTQTVAPSTDPAEDVVCEEILLDAFRK